MESGFLYAEAIFPVTAKNIIIFFKCVDVFADDVVYYVLD